MVRHLRIISVLSIIVAWIIFLIFLFPHSSLYWISFWWMFPVALLIAITVNTVGISGSALFVPFFILVFPLFAHPLSTSQSVMLALITESFGLSSSALAFWWFGLIDLKLGFRTILVAIPFVLLGSILSAFLSDSTLGVMVSIALLIAIVLMLNKKRQESKIKSIENKIVGVHHKHKFADNITISDKQGNKFKYCRFCGMKKRLAGYSLGGLFQGSTGFGIGELGILSMALTNIPIRIAIGTSHMIVAVTAIFASLIHLKFSFSSGTVIPWNILITTVPAVLLGGQIAPYISAKLKTNVLEYFVILLFVFIAIILLWISLF